MTIDRLPKDHLEDSQQRYDQYIHNLTHLFNDSARHTMLPLNLNRNITEEARGLSWNVLNALSLVNTPFVYMIQHDVPFEKDFDHTGIVKTMVEYQNDLRAVRFDRKMSMPIGTSKHGADCWNMCPLLLIQSMVFILLSKRPDGSISKYSFQITKVC
jgi:hypothetical protein